MEPVPNMRHFLSLKPTVLVSSDLLATAEDTTTLHNTVRLLTDSLTAPPSTAMVLTTAKSSSTVSFPTPTSSIASSTLTAKDASVSTGPVLRKTSSHQNVVLGSILGGALALALCMIILFGLTYFRNRKRKYSSKSTHIESQYAKHAGRDSGIVSMKHPETCQELADEEVLKDSAPRVQPPARFDHSPFHAEDLLRITRIPHIPPMSEKRKSMLESKRTERGRMKREAHGIHAHANQAHENQAHEIQNRHTEAGQPKSYARKETDQILTMPAFAIDTRLPAHREAKETSAEDILHGRFSQSSSIYSPHPFRFTQTHTDAAPVLARPRTDSNYSSTANCSSPHQNLASGRPADKRNPNHTNLRAHAQVQQQIPEVYDDGHGEYPEFQFDI